MRGCIKEEVPEVPTNARNHENVYCQVKGSIAEATCHGGLNRKHNSKYPKGSEYSARVSTGPG